MTVRLTLGGLRLCRIGKRERRTRHPMHRAVSVIAVLGIAALSYIAPSLSPLTTAPASAESPASETKPAPQAPTLRPKTDAPKPRNRGPVTNLPMPRFVSLKANKANLRRGPSLSHRIDWVFKHRGYPLEVIAEYGHWRRVRDNEDATGWIHYTLISGARTAVVLDQTIDLFRKPDTGSRLNAQAERGAILRLLACDVSWCQASGGGQKGWVLKSGIWGVYGAEILE